MPGGANDTQQEQPPASAAAPTSEEVAPAYARRVLDEVRAGIALVRSGRFHAPAPQWRTRRVFYPLGVMVALWRAMWRDRALRTRYLRAMLPQVALVVVAGIAWVFFIDGVDTSGFNFEATSEGLTITNAAKDTERAALSLTTILVSLYTTMSIIEWIIVAFTREHHDALSWEVSSAVGVPPEERIENPRVHLDVQWLVTKMKRRIQGGIILLVSAVPPAVAVTAIVMPLALSLAKALAGVKGSNPVINLLANVPSNLFITAFGAYWLGVFTLGKTAHAWRDEIVDDPFYLRRMDALADRFPRLFGWLHLYARVLRRALGLVRRPSWVVERAPWETAGLVLLRIVISLPAVYVLVRPLIPVTATVIIAARSPETLKGLPVSIVLDERYQ